MFIRFLNVIGIGILGMPGSTAYGDLIDIIRPKENDTIFISGAAGAVGSMVGQLAKALYNATVIGSCGGPNKAELIKTKFHFDHSIDYKKHSDVDSLTQAIKDVAPQGINSYFENVGGIHFNAAFNNLAPGGVIAVCGQISEYNDSIPVGNNINLMKMIYSAQRIEGFMCYPWLSGKKGMIFLFSVIYLLKLLRSI